MYFCLQLLKHKSENLPLPQSDAQFFSNATIDGVWKRLLKLFGISNLILGDSIIDKFSSEILWFFKLSSCVQFTSGMCKNTSFSIVTYSILFKTLTHFSFVHICKKYFKESINLKTFWKSYSTWIVCFSANLKL